MHKALTIINITALICVAVMLTAVLVLALVKGSLPFNFNFEKETTKITVAEVSAENIKKINVDSKNISTVICASDENKIRAVLETTYKEGKRAEVSAIADGDTFTAEVRDKIRVGIFFGREQLVIYIPASYTDNMKLTASSGNIHIDESASEVSFANVSAVSSSGSVYTDDLRAESFVLKSKSGSVHAENVTGSGEMSSTSGSIHVETVRGENLMLSSKSGSINAGVVAGSNIKATSTSGSVKIEELTGIAECCSTSGSVRIGTVKGICTLSSTSGSVTAEEFTGGGSVKSVSGGVKLGKITLTGNLTLESSSGSVRAEFDGLPSARIEASSKSGGVRSELTPDGANGRDYYSASIGGGQYSVKASSTSGSVYFTLDEN